MQHSAGSKSGPSTLRTATHKLDCKRGSARFDSGLAQTSDGYLWVGTANGLCRFDGVNVEPFEPSSGGRFPGHIVESLLAMPDGGLFIGFRNAGVAFLKNEKATTYADASGMEQATVRKLALALDGTVWAATSCNPSEEAENLHHLWGLGSRWLSSTIAS